MSACAEVQRALGRYLAMELPQATDRWVRAHVQDCAACRASAEEREPSLIFAGALSRPTQDVEDDAFVPAVMAAVHQRRLEARIRLRRRRWLTAAAAAAGVLLAGLGTLRQGPVPGPLVAQRPMVQPAVPLAPATVEVEGENVRLYQLSGSASGEVQVAFIIDPGLEL